MSEIDEDKPDAELIALFNERDGMPTTIRFRDGRELTVLNIAWGYDIHDEYAHVTTNCSPFVEDMPPNLFYTDEVVEVRDPETGAVLADRRQ